MKYGNFKCGCGSDNIRLDIGYDGLDELSVAGEGSGFGVVVSLCCTSCGRGYPVCRVKDFTDVSDIVVPE